MAFYLEGRRIENGVFLGPLGFLTFEGIFSWNKIILTFVFERIRIKLGSLKPFEFSFKGENERELSKQDPFFIWFYIDEEIAVARGKSGGTGFWVHCKHAEGIFRTNPENSQEEELRDQLNRGKVPNDINVHCLADLIKEWFRELPSGVLEGLSPEQVLQCNTEGESVDLVKQLKPTESGLLNWVIDLMDDVVEHDIYCLC